MMDLASVSARRRAPGGRLQVEVRPTILPCHGRVHAARHVHQDGTRPSGQIRRPHPAWRPQSMMRLPAVMAPSRELSAGVGGECP
jgi:hypothetical protein